ncbi:MAG: glycolate oxidase subunit GlcE [Exilibacterium sp.]
MGDLTQDLIEQVNTAIAAASALTIAGGNSKRFIGRETQADTTVDISGHSGIVSYEPVELVLTARAGTRIREIQDTLAENGQVLAFEPPQLHDRATLGGTLACNLSGPARPWSGSVRDAVLGTRLINGRGEHLRFGGQVMKNVAGYDASRAQAGALGTLGVITEISLKVMPKPAAGLTLVQEMSAADALLRMNKLAAQPRPLTGACWHDGKLYLRLAGTSTAVKSTVRSWGGSLLEADENFWQSLREYQHPFFAGTDSLWRFSINSTAPHWRENDDWLIDWGGSQRWLRGDFDFTGLQTEARQANGQVSLFRGGNRSGEVYQEVAPTIRLLHQRLKKAFDPQGIFNPGRLYSWM